jgi:glyoxylase-like metal-dependent hydrolase (beta-lactamase superfamily II)
VRQVRADDVHRRHLAGPDQRRDLQRRQTDDLGNAVRARDSSASVHDWTVTATADTFRSESWMSAPQPTYTGDVEVGGPADVRELPGLTISKLAVSEMANNAYLLRDTATGEALLIDAAAEPAKLRELISNADLRTVVTTHGHWDHHRALPDVVRETGAATVAHAADADDLPVDVERTVDHGDSVTVGGHTLEVVHLRGHTPGSIALVYRAQGDGGVHVFTGDSLFPGGVGNTQKDPARFASLIDDVEERLFGTLPDETWVYPGHGKDTTLGAERPHLGEWRARGW